MLSLSKTIKKQPTGRILALGFLAVILAGSLLLMLPVCRIDGAELRYIDSLFTATSAVCVTGLVTVDVASTFSPLGQFVVALLIQIGGLGVASAGAALFLIMGKRVSIKGRSLLKDGLNLGSGGGIVRMLNSGTHTFGSYADWAMCKNGETDASDPVFIKQGGEGKCTLTFDTSDWSDATVPRRIACRAPICGQNAAQAGYIALVVKGCGRWSSNPPM